MSKSSGDFRFRKNDNVGAYDAEDDQRFLSMCFEDTGDCETLLDCKHPARIVLGRTGTGKTALVLELQRRSEHVIAINPEHLSLNYVANSTILQYLTSLGINLDPFYKLLWRHVFAVTLIQHRFDITDEEKQKGFLEHLREYFESKDVKAERHKQVERRRKAIEYLRKWGDKFFQDVEHRTKEVATHFETEVADAVKAKLGYDLRAKLPPVSSAISGHAEASTETKDKMQIDQTTEIIERAKHAVNSIQVQELGGIIELLSEILDDPQKPFFIVIDRLDEQWADEAVRYNLLKGLIDAVKEFGKVHYAKIIICLRIDLIEQLFRHVRSEAGFQEDKYRSLYLPLRWNREHLIALLDRRIAALIRDRYTGYTPTHKDILPPSVRVGQRKDKQNTIDFILARTWNRPRDIIEFLNLSIGRCEGKPRLTQEVILDVEADYSRNRLRAIYQEWYKDYFELPEAVKAFVEKRPSRYLLNEITQTTINDWSLAVACTQPQTKGRLWDLAAKFIGCELPEADFRRNLASILYRTGIVGLKMTSTSPVRWADNESYTIALAELDDQVQVYVHPGLWRVLGITHMDGEQNE